MAVHRFARLGEIRWRIFGFLAAAVFALVLAGVSDRANARTNGDRATDTRKRPAKAQTGPILAVVSLARQRIWIYGGGGLIAQSAVSTGMAGHRTPAGVFSVLQKNRFHQSNIYSNAPMPFMQRITWSGVALHAGVLPGYPASHGCIRLPHQFAVDLWGMTKVGARVVVVPDDASVFHIDHSRLPVPRLAPAPPAEGSLAKHADMGTGTPATSSAGVVGVSLRDALSETEASPGRLLNPVERAKLARVRAIAAAAAKAKAAKAAIETSAVKAAEASRAIAALREAEWVLTKARAKRDASAAAASEGETTPEAAERADSALAAAEARLAGLEKEADAARVVEAIRTPEALAAARAAWAAEQASAAAAEALKATERSTEPLSILVSKKTGRVYVRHAWTTIHEAPVAFRQPDLPVGTHVYLATAPDEDGRALRWLSVSIPPSPAPPSPATSEVPAGAKQGAREQAVPVNTAPAGQSSHTALTALARFELPDETARLIEDRLWTGATLIVSDEGISSETGATTDFILLTR